MNIAASTSRLPYSGAGCRVRAIVTGARGMLGAALVDELNCNPNYIVVPLGRQDADLMDRVETERRFADARPDIVFHLAARVAGLGGNLAQAGRMYYENVIINTNVVEAARRAGARKVVAAGTAAIYSDLIPLPMSEGDLWLGPPHGSERAYGQAKRAMLAQLEAYRDDYGLDFTYCILTNIFGPRDNFDEAHGHVVPSLISKFHRGVISGAPVNVWGSGSAVRDFLYSCDAARAMALTAENFTGVINIASGGTISIRDLVATLRQVSGFAGDVDWDATKPDGQKQRGYDIAKLQRLGFAPAWTLAAALGETWAWYVAHAASARR